MGTPPKPATHLEKSWDDDETARRYAEFAREFPMYRETSRDVVAAAGPSHDAVVVDLCCGTGVTTQAILESLGPNGRVLAIDASDSMLTQARNQVTDPRVQFTRSPAEELTSVVGGPLDAVICNSAIWQTDFAKVSAAVGHLLRPGGTFTFNIGRRFLIMPFSPDELAPRQPGLSDIATAIAILEYDFVPTFRPSGPRRPPLTVEGITLALAESDLVVDEPRVVEYDMTAEQRAAWLSIPVFSDQTPGRTYEEKREILGRALTRIGPDHSESYRWLLFKATKP